MLDNEKEMIQKVYSYCKNYFLNKNIFPSIKQIINHTGLNRDRIVSILKLLVNHKYIKYKNKRYYLK